MWCLLLSLYIYTHTYMHIFVYMVCIFLLTNFLHCYCFFNMICKSCSCSTETVNFLRTEGQAKVGGTLVCVFGALLMILFRGPSLIGYTESEFAAHSEIIIKGQPEPAVWFMPSFLKFGLDQWHLGVLCLIGNCVCAAAYIAIQVFDNLSHFVDFECLLY
ncbi:hypothetical protein CsSME_00049505 [Camellia sinensis var. sinensis]